MRSDLHGLYPSIYNEVLETDILADVGDIQFNEFFALMDNARKNQFVLTADERGIAAFERIYEIRADPAIENLEFRRERLLNRIRTSPPFTFRFLLQRLDEIIGAGKYKAWLGRGRWHTRLGSWVLGRTPFRDPEYTLFIEATAQDTSWYQEVQIFVNKIKPANIVYTITPLIARGIEISESISAMPRSWNYRLGGWQLGPSAFMTEKPAHPTTWNYRLGGWRLGSATFGTEPLMEVVKLPVSPSIQPSFLGAHARFSASEIAAVRLNGAYTISDLKKAVDGPVTTIQYVITPSSGLKEITQIELLRAPEYDTATDWNYSLGHWTLGRQPFGYGSFLILDKAAVYIPVPYADQLIFKHTITHKEGQ